MWIWRQLSLRVECCTACLLEDSGASAWTLSTQQQSLHIAARFFTRLKTLLWMAPPANAKLGSTLGAGLGFLVLIMCHLLAAGVLELRLHKHFIDQKFLWHRKEQFVSLSFPS